MEFTSSEEMDQPMRNIPNNSEELSQWDRLPPHILLQIYLYQYKDDQCSMSLVCKNWAQLFDIPELWRRINYPLFQKRKGNRLQYSKIFTEKDLIKNYGHMAKHLTITDIDYCHCSDCVGQHSGLTELFSITQLESLTFHHVTRIGNCIVVLLKTQNNLLNFEIKNCKLSAKDVRQIWLIMSQKKLKRFRMINVGWNDQFGTGIVDETRFARLWLLFIQIEEVEIFNCSRICEFLINSFHTFVKRYKVFKPLIQAQDGKLKSLKLSYRVDNESNTINASVKSWELIALVCPKVKVTVDISAECKKIEAISAILPPPILLWNLSIKNEEKNGESLKHFLYHLSNAGYSKTLKELRIKWQLEDGDSSLFKVFIRSCPKLKIAEIENC